MSAIDKINRTNFLPTKIPTKVSPEKVNEIIQRLNAITEEDGVLNNVTSASIESASIDEITTEKITGSEALILDIPVTAPGAGFNGEGGVIYAPGGQRGANGLIVTEWYVDLAEAAVSSKDTAGDIIGEAGGGVAYIGQVTAANNGTIVGMEVICLEAPTTGDPDIDIVAAEEATGEYDDLVTDLTQTVLLTAGGSWTLGMVKAASALPAADSYIYLCTGNGVAGAYATGKFLIRMYGTV